MFSVGRQIDQAGLDPFQKGADCPPTNLASSHEQRWGMPGLGRLAPACASWDNAIMPDATITVDAALKERLSDLASQTGQRVDEFVEALLRRVAEADVRFERCVPVFPRRPGAPTLTVEDVDRLADGQ